MKGIRGMSEQFEKFIPEYHELSTGMKYTVESIKKAIENKDIIYGLCVKSDDDYTISIELNKDTNTIIGKVPFEEIEYRIGNLDIKPVSALSRVGHTVAVVPLSITTTSECVEVLCSRKAAQEKCFNNYIKKLKSGDIIEALALRSEKYGVFCDIGCGITALLPAHRISVTHVPSVHDMVREGTKLKVILNEVMDNGKIQLSHKELLGTWEQNVADFEAGQAVVGTVISVQSYGIFVRIAQNLSGLASLISEEQHMSVVAGDQVSVYIKAIIPESMKVKLNIINKLGSKEKPTNFKYYIENGHIDKWVYNPKNYDYSKDNKRVVETTFE